MTHVLVLTAVDVEARGLARHLGLERVTTAGFPHFRAGVLEIACIGPRGSHLVERVRACAEPDLVVSAGACGALADGLRAGDLVVPEVVLTPAGARLSTASLTGLARRGALLCVADVVETAAAKARLWLETAALAVDMESAPILAWAAGRGVPAAVVRGVSDTAREAVAPEMAALVEPGGRVRTAQALRLALTRPARIADAVALGRGTAAALKSVATALAGLARTVGARG